MEYRSLSGRKYNITPKQVGKGGEGHIFEVSNFKDALAKLYKSEFCTDNREQKLLTMLRMNITEELDMQLAWPKDILYDNNGHFCGFVMRKVKGEVLDSIFDDKKLPLPKRITIAKNLCIAIHGAHSTGNIIIGDLNPYNILLNSSLGLLTLIDNDSFHITDEINGAVYGCEMLTPDYISPAISNSVPKGQTLKSVSIPTFTRESDIWSLAVIIFQILTNGTHPFSVALSKDSPPNAVPPKPSELMKKRIFPYENCPYGFCLPLYALPYKMLTERLRVMFSKTFRGEYIPIERWYDALCDFEKNLKSCKTVPSHKYRKGLLTCPYCSTEKRTQNFFKKHQRR